MAKQRPVQHQDCRKKGLLAGPHKHVIQVKNDQGKVKTMLIDPSVFDKLMAKRNMNLNQKSTASSAAKPSDTTCRTKRVNHFLKDIPSSSSTVDSKEIKVETDESISSSQQDCKIESLHGSKASDISHPSAKQEDSKDDVEIIDVKKGMNKSGDMEKEKANDPHSCNDISSEKQLDEEGKVDSEDKSLSFSTSESLEVKKQSDSISKESIGKSIKLEEDRLDIDQISRLTVKHLVDTVVSKLGDEEKLKNSENKSQSESSDSMDIDVKEETASKEEKMEVDESTSSTDEKEGTSKEEKKSTEDISSKDLGHRKLKTELVNVSLGIVSANRILYPKIAKKAPVLDELLARRMMLQSIEEKELNLTYGEETIAKAKLGKEVFSEIKDPEEDKEDQTQAEVLEEGFPLGGIYVYDCYSSICREAAGKLTKKKGPKNHEMLCYSPMCRLKYCMQYSKKKKEDQLKAAEIEKLQKKFDEIESKRMYSNGRISGKVHLKMLPGEVANLKKPNGKFPVSSSFRTALTKKSSILILPQYELNKIARTGGRYFNPLGFTNTPKANAWAWPYPCGRPLFRTAWQYRVIHADSLPCAALHMRILQAVIRWDDILVSISKSFLRMPFFILTKCCIICR